MCVLQSDCGMSYWAAELERSALSSGVRGLLLSPLCLLTGDNT